MKNDWVLDELGRWVLSDSEGRHRGGIHLQVYMGQQRWIWSAFPVDYFGHNDSRTVSGSDESVEISKADALEAIRKMDAAADD